jgi:dipeptidyl aminopeptidase/acylaminoacyl peptidase
MAREPRLCRAFGQLSRFYRLREGFRQRGDREHAAKMHDDLLDAVEWAVREGIARRDRIAIMGGSYGGYASFVGATFTPKSSAALCRSWE